MKVQYFPLLQLQRDLHDIPRGTSPSLEPADLAYTREVLAPLMGASDRPTVMACLYGDEAARAVGYPPQGLSDWAGFALVPSSVHSRAGVPSP